MANYTEMLHFILESRKVEKELQSADNLKEPELVSLQIHYTFSYITYIGNNIVSTQMDDFGHENFTDFLKEVYTRPNAEQQNLVPIEAIIHLSEKAGRDDIETYMESMFR